MSMTGDLHDTTEDWALLGRWIAGDRRAGNELLARYFDPLTRFFRNKVRVADEVADLVSDTLLACTQNRAAIRDARSFRSYVFGVAYRQLRYHYRKHHKRGREADDFLDVCVDERGTPSPSTMLGRRAETRLLLRALRAIKLDYQIVLELKVFEGLNGREIAELLGLPTATVHTRLRRGREQLAAAVERLAASPVEGRSTIGGLETWARELRVHFAIDRGAA